MNGLLFISKALICLCSPQTLLDSSPAHINDKQKGDLGLIKPEMMAGVPLLLGNQKFRAISECWTTNNHLLN